MTKVVFCGSIVGQFRVSRGRQVVIFEDHKVFGPSSFDGRTGEIEAIDDNHTWFWLFYPAWVQSGRPTTGQTLSTPAGELKFARWPNTKEA